MFLNALGNKKNIKTDYIGLQSFKGVGRLIDVYAINNSKLKKPNAKDYINENIIVDYEKLLEKAEDDDTQLLLNNDIEATITAQI